MTQSYVPFTLSLEKGILDNWSWIYLWMCSLYKIFSTPECIFKFDL